VSLLLALTAPVGYEITADAGSYSVTGVAAGVAVGKVLQASAGAYLVSGVAAGIAKTKVIEAGAGAYVYTGSQATIARTGGASSNSGGFFEYPMRRRPIEVFEELEASEPVVAQEIEQLAKSDKKTLTNEQMQAHLASVGLAYKQAYTEIYLGLIEEIRQEQETEAIATCMAAML